MKEIFLLTKILLKNSLSSQKKTKQSKKDNILKAGEILKDGTLETFTKSFSFDSYQKSRE